MTAEQIINKRKFNTIGQTQYYDKGEVLAAINEALEVGATWKEEQLQQRIKELEERCEYWEGVAKYLQSVRSDLVSQLSNFYKQA